MSQRLLGIWLILTMATIVSWYSDAIITGSWISTLVLMVAFFKARLVLFHFMDIGSASALLRGIANTWVVFACACLVILSWLTTPPY